MRAIVVNAGNTYTELALLNDDKLGNIQRCNTRQLLDGLEPDWLGSLPDVPIVVATVVPKLREAWRERNVTWITAGLSLGVDFSGVDMETLGADRVANAVAAAELLKLPAIVVDCGTAITFEVVDTQKRFLGGAILPGRKLAREALFSGTAQLPDVPIEDELPAVLGTNTPSAIRSGVDIGVLGAVERLLCDFKKKLGAKATAIAVGGDRDYVCKHIVGLQTGQPDFTLWGVAAAAKLLVD